MEKSKPTPYSIGEFGIENIIASGELRPAPIDLNEVVKYLVAEFRPEKLPGAVIRFRRPDTMATIYHSGKFSMNVKSDEIKKAARKFKRILRASLNKPFKLSYEVKNVVGSGSLNQGIDCGTLGAIFPNSKKAFGEGHRVYVGDSKANFVYFPSGKVVGIAFDSTEKIRTELDNQIGLINRNLDSVEESRKGICFMERSVPAIRSYYALVNKAASNGVKLSTEDRLRGRQYIERFLENEASQKHNLGNRPGTFGAATLYLLAESNPSINDIRYKRLPQRVISELTGLTEVSIRSAKDRMLKSIGNI